MGLGPALPEPAEATAALGPGPETAEVAAARGLVLPKTAVVTAALGTRPS
ncbi:hypothetical protein HD597_001225 [Nonomuraea thailandensis]|uniref:Uncharacterized protein n=2 Tax=Nonomuraea thailandensis TaxID=1188745 RepID=A0A9X2JZW8_9ACTN|nr:hypothetical protein [Nonomuraea thailandensis]